MKRNPEETCATCPYWGKYLHDEDMGTCRRRAPKRISLTSDEYFYWDAPDTSTHDWCGEHPDFFLDEDGTNGG